MPLDAGRLRDRIAVYTRTATRTALGVEETWTQDSEFWGRMGPIKLSAQRDYMQAHNSEVTHQAIFRHNPTVAALTTTGHRLRWRDNDYEIIAPVGDPDGTGRFASVLVKRLD